MESTISFNCPICGSIIELNLAKQFGRGKFDKKCKAYCIIDVITNVYNPNDFILLSHSKENNFHFNSNLFDFFYKNEAFSNEHCYEHTEDLEKNLRSASNIISLIIRNRHLL